MREILISSTVLLFFAGSPAAAQAVRMFGLEGEGGGYLGVSMRDVTAADVAPLQLPKESGVLIQRVEADSPAAEARLQEGDVIVEYAGIPVLGARQFRRLVSDTPPGRNVEMKISRAGGSLMVTAEIGQRSGSLAFDGPEGPWSFNLPEPGWRWEGPRDRRIFVHRAGPRLGIGGATLTEQMAAFLGIPGTEGVLVMEVAAESPAEKAGLKAGDVVTAVEGRPVRTTAALSRALSGDRNELAIVRDGRSLRLTVEPTADNPGSPQADRL